MKEFLPPSLVDVIKERFARTEKTWAIEHTRVLQALEQAGISERLHDKLLTIMYFHTKAAGFSAVSADLLLTAVTAGAGAQILRRSQPMKFMTPLGFEIENMSLTKGIGLATEFVAAGVTYVGPIQQASRFGARLYGSVAEAAVNVVASYG